MAIAGSQASIYMICEGCKGSVSGMRGRPKRDTDREAGPAWEGARAHLQRVNGAAHQPPTHAECSQACWLHPKHRKADLLILHEYVAGPPVGLDGGR